MFRSSRSVFRVPALPPASPANLRVTALYLFADAPLLRYRSYADGTHEVVSERIKPTLPHLRPALSPDAQTYFTGEPLPEIVDISKYGAPKEHEVPKWRPKSDFLVVSCMSPDFACHHGACRLRD